MGEKQGKKIKVYIAAVLFVFLIVGGSAYWFTHNKSYRNDALECGGQDEEIIFR